ncbi:hypothetical protein PROFUN_07279 [Planoprotostelium fungivorum]|uniref:Uncharacterized protein n=1 Tax=Planoprotostelium fungivorum TaxID=1890364 RepID=A0A2P6NLZ7_9EUKA|nr:hypothetical protein PROFUN_07279 [Planoprotostelium fungivorum]
MLRSWLVYCTNESSDDAAPSVFISMHVSSQKRNVDPETNSQGNTTGLILSVYHKYRGHILYK